MIMRLSKALIDMEMADYSAALDPAYTTLEFENMQVLAIGNGKSNSQFSLLNLRAGVTEVHLHMCRNQVV